MQGVYEPLVRLAFNFLLALRHLADSNRSKLIFGRAFGPGYMGEEGSDEQHGVYGSC